jgi:Methyltransferase domain
MKQTNKSNILNRSSRFLWSKLSLLVKHMATTGQGTDECLEIGCLPMNVHFYSPIPDIKDLESRKVWERKSELPGIDFHPSGQLALLAQLGSEFGSECDWPLTPTSIPTQFYLKNNSFSYGCASALHTMIRHFKPRHFIEVGSGHSSKVISKALEMNKHENTLYTPEYIIVDPYPSEMVSAQLPSVSRVLNEKVECVNLEMFEILGENDILFVDSGHTARTGSDVNFIILEVLPRLRPGVIIHFHDINLPYEYPKVYFTNPQFRMFWTEAYLLQAFLTLNRDFEILLALNYLQTDHMSDYCNAFPHFKLADNWANSGSFWIRRRI